MRMSAAALVIILILAISPFAQAPAGQTAADLPLHTKRFSDRVVFA